MAAGSAPAERRIPWVLTPDDLLAPASNEAAGEYYQELMSAVQRSTVGGDTAEGFEVRLDAGGGKGKGLFATRSFEEGVEVLRESPFAAVQSLGNRADCLVCDNCFRFVGSIELQIAWRLMARATHAGDSPSTQELQAISRRLLTGQLVLPHPHMTALPKAVPCLNGCHEVYCSTRCCAAAWARHHCLTCPAACSDERVTALRRLGGSCPHTRAFDMADLLKWPHDCRAFRWLLDAFDLPDPHENCETAAATPPPSSPRPDATERAAATAASAPPRPFLVPAAGEARRGDAGAAVDQLAASHTSSRALPRHPPESSGGAPAVRGLCPKGGRPAGASGDVAAVPSGARDQSCGGAGSRLLQQRLLLPEDGALPMPPWAQDVMVCREVNAQLLEYSATSDIDALRFVAQIVAQTILSALLLVWVAEGPSPARDGALLSPTQRSAWTRFAQLLQGEGEGGPPPVGLQARAEDGVIAATLAVWTPIQVAMKQAWWDCASVPPHVNPDLYRQSLRVMVTNLVALLKGAFFDARFEALFDTDVVANLMGLSEFNALSITVESPLEDHFDELKTKRASASLRQSAGQSASVELSMAWQLYEVHLQGETDVACDGLAFYCLQSCINHDNDPNCTCQKEIEEADGSAVCVTLRRVEPGDELCISYIGRVSRMSPAEVKTALAAYGIHTPDT